MPEDIALGKFASMTPPTPEQCEAARKVVCLNSADAHEAEIFLSMLGLL